MTASGRKLLPTYPTSLLLPALLAVWGWTWFLPKDPFFPRQDIPAWGFPLRFHGWHRGDVGGGAVIEPRFFYSRLMIDTAFAILAAWLSVLLIRVLVRTRVHSTVRSGDRAGAVPVSPSRARRGPARPSGEGWRGLRPRTR